MSVAHFGHHGHPIDAERVVELAKLYHDPKFKAALAAYIKTDETHDVPYLGGSNTGGDTVFFDHRLSPLVTAGKLTIHGKPYDPRPFIWLHEAVEGALIRLYGLDYSQSHDIATVAERQAITQAFGPKGWEEHQDALHSVIGEDEREKVINPPRDLLLTPYLGTALYAKLKSFQDKGAQDMPVVSKAQNRAMYSAAAGHSTLGIPKSVGQDFVAATPPGSVKSLPEHVGMAKPAHHHALRMASATALFKAGDIDQAMHGKIHASARRAMAMMKRHKPPAATRHNAVEPRPFGHMAGPKMDNDRDDY
jgi:hypothetical protein